MRSNERAPPQERSQTSQDAKKGGSGSLPNAPRGRMRPLSNYSETPFFWVLQAHKVDYGSKLDGGFSSRGGGPPPPPKKKKKKIHALHTKINTIMASASPSRADLYQRSMRSWKDTAEAYEHALDELLRDNSLISVCRDDPDFEQFESLVAELLQKQGVSLRNIVAHLRLLRVDERPPRGKKIGRGTQETPSVDNDASNIEAC